MVCTLLVAGCASSRPADSSVSPQPHSALIGAILSAENRRVADDPVFAVAAGHPDTQVSALARRATARIVDSAFALRTEFPVVAPPVWPEPAWRVRFRALNAIRADCSAMAAALVDPSWLVRLRAADVVAETCGTDARITGALQGWIRTMPADVSRRAAGEMSWHPAAHAMLALSRLVGTQAAPIVRRFATHDNHHLRQYAARSALGADVVPVLGTLARDHNPNVRVAAIDALSSWGGHSQDSIFVTALSASEAQVVRAAAIALKGSTDLSAKRALEAALARWSARQHDPERDVRVALRAALGVASADVLATRYAVPAEAVGLARGADVRVRVTMAPEGGGGFFVVRMRGDIAPITSARILELVDRGYYNGTGWHRAEHDFVIQGGSPGEHEYVGASPFFVDELGTVPHVRGTIGMSTRGHDSGDGQWFVNLRDNLRLGRDYTVFAEVIEGIEVVDRIMEGDVIASMERVR